MKNKIAHTFLWFFVLLFIAPFNSIAQNQDSIILKGTCFLKDSILNTKIRMKSASVIITFGKSRVRKSMESDNKGNFQFCLPSGQEYFILGKKMGYFNTEKIKINTAGLKKGDTVHQDVVFQANYCYGPAQIRYSEPNKIELDSNAIKILDMQCVTIKEYPYLVFEIASYTDCRGTSSYCDSLSLQRAIVVKHYLESKGIDSARLVPHGHGKNSQITGCNCNGNKNDNEHECTSYEIWINNRTELKALKFDYNPSKE